MKRLFSLFAAALCITALFAGCSKDAPKTEEAVREQAAETASRDFTTGASIEYGGLTIKAQITKDNDGESTVVIESPDTIKGLTFTTTKEGDVSLNYKGLSTDIDPDSFVGKTLIQAAFKAINLAGNPQGISVSQTDGGVQLISSTEGMDFTLALDKESGNFLELSVPEESLNIRFENFTFSKDAEA